MPTTASVTYDPSLRLDPYFNANEAKAIPVNLADGSYAKGTVLGELTATPGTYKAYASGNSDGSQVPKGFLVYACVAASGAITVANQQGVTQRDVPMYYSGEFKTTDLTGLDANAVAVLNGNYISGVLADGVIRIG